MPSSDDHVAKDVAQIRYVGVQRGAAARGRVLAIKGVEHESLASGRPAAATSIAMTTRCFGPPKPLARPSATTSTGPSTRYSTAPP